MNKLEKFLIFFSFVAVINCDLFSDYVEKYEIKIPSQKTRAKYRNQFYLTRSEVFNFNSRKGNLYKQAVNQFAHLSVNEVAQEQFGLEFTLLSRTLNTSHVDASVKCGYVDWRQNGSVTAVKNQGSCGDCFVFSAIASIESQILMKFKINCSLSEQFVMDCINPSFKIANNSCNGGMPEYVYMLTIIKGGLPLTESVPYLGYDRNTCPSNVPMFILAKTKSFKTLSPAASEDQLACMLLNGGPLSVAIYVNTTLLRYGGGIYNDVASCRPNAIPNHSVLLVGYGKDTATNVEYFIFKNSWGTSYGEKGYFRMQKGLAMCQILSLVEQPSIV